MCAFGQQDRLLSLSCNASGADSLLPDYLVGTEGISELFLFQLDLLAPTNVSIDPKAIVGQKATVSINLDDVGSKRHINGIIYSLEISGGDEELNSYRAWIVPNIAILKLNKNTRVFQDKTVIEVVKAVLSDYVITLGDETSNTYSKMEYCTQYRETDFDFVSRLLEQHGIFYYFKHTENDHTFTIQDHSDKLKPCATQSSFRYAPAGSTTEGFYDFVISEFKSMSRLVPGKYTAWDYGFVGFRSSTSKLEGQGVLGPNKNEICDYANSAAAYIKKIDSQGELDKRLSDLNTVRSVAENAEAAVVEGASNAICLESCFTFEMTKHPQGTLNAKYLVKHVKHVVPQIPAVRSKTKEDPQPYSNTFIAMPSSLIFKPPIKTRKPVVHGMHTGQVVVPSGEDSHMDKYGRVCVRFWWDRIREPDTNTVDNTLLRVAQQWAGKGWGTYFWPRVDDEVLISFIEGDPDQPIVVGSVYNGKNMPKYDPAGQYTLSGILTRSSKNGGAANANELRFEDLQGKEQIFMNAEKDYDLHVENDWHTTVGNEQHTFVKKDQFEEVDGDAHLLVKGKQLHEVDGEAHLNVKGNQIVKVGGDRSHDLTGNLKEQIGQNSNISVGSNLNEQVGQNYSLTVGMKQVIQAGTNFDVIAPVGISLNCGPNTIVLSPEGIGLNGMGGFISIGPSGVTISGLMVMINSGGAPVTGSPGSAQSPQSPESPTAPKAPTFPGDDPYSKPASQS